MQQRIKTWDGTGLLLINPECHMPIRTAFRMWSGDDFQTRFIQPAKLSIKDPKTELPICSFQGSYWHVYYN
ncbi:hypothetical protein I79_003874 [Cricetulus griseus]|uniref:Uncharacterized protein n=1 Tax=Cricetulus griseus TaxID=10029 RepID=G3H150_CRIGR|nr:hypothetical protein I79_003874 [Cricetulus griseus]